MLRKIGLSRCDYLDSPEGRIIQARSRRHRRLHLDLAVEPQSKSAMSAAEKLAVQDQLVNQMRRLRRRRFRGKVAAEIRLAATAPTPPHLYAATKNILDLFGAPLGKHLRRQGLVYGDDSQVRALSVIYDVSADTPGISATFAPLSDFILDIGLASDVESGILPGSEDLHEEYVERRANHNAIEEFFRLEADPIPVSPETIARLLIHSQREAQAATLASSRIRVRELHYLYAEATLRSQRLDLRQLIDLQQLVAANHYATLNRWFVESPIRITLPQPPMKSGERRAFRLEIERVLERFERRLGRLFRPFLTPIALEVVYKPPPGASRAQRRDLDNLMRIVLGCFTERFKPPANLSKAFELPEDSSVARDLLHMPLVRLPPKSIEHSAIRMDVFEVGRSSVDGTPGFFIMGVAADFPVSGSVWSQADDLIGEWEQSFERRLY